MQRLPKYEWTPVQRWHVCCLITVISYFLTASVGFREAIITDV
jgi:hypothetical protein